MECKSVQTYVGANGNLWIGNVDTGVLIKKAYFGAGFVPQNYQSGNNMVMFNSLQDESGEISLSTDGTSVNLTGGYDYRITVEGTMYSQALTTPSLSVYFNSIQIASQSKGIAISGGQTFTAAIDLIIRALGDGIIIIKAEDNNVAVSNMNITVEQLGSL